MEGVLGWALPAARAVHDAALALLFGGLLFPRYALRGAHAPWPALGPWLGVEAAAALVSAPVVFCLSVAGMAGDLGGAWNLPLLGDTLKGGEVGWLFAARLALLALCGLFLAAARRRTACLLAGVALAALALTGHAREGEGWRMMLHVALDAAHLLCAGLWLGALPWFGVVLSDRFAAEDALPAVRRFSAVASLAVALLLLTGAGATLLLVGSPLALAVTLWGRLLLVKAALAAVMVTLAAHNRWRSTPALADARAAAAARLRRNARLELALGLAIFALVGWIGTLPFTPGD